VSRFSRRQALGLGAATAAGAAGIVLAESSGASVFRTGHGEPAAAEGTAVPFHGEHQAGIASAVQDRLHMAAFDVTTESRDEVIALLKAWTAAAARMTQGREAVAGGAIPAMKEAPPGDTGEALGLPASRLTITIGFGPTFFEKDGRDRFGLRGKRPAALVDLPHFPQDALDPARSGGDIVVQACSDDPQVAVHAVRNLARIGFGTVAVRWSQLGFGKTSSTTPQAQTPRNLFGFKDGTNNIAGDDADALRRHVWADAADGAAWMAGGSYLVARRIRMHIETWDRSSLNDQEGVIGRTKGSGAPLGGTQEFEPANLKATDANGTPVIPPRSHIRLAAAESLNGIKILRRGFNFVDGADGLGHLNAGLFFICFIRNPGTQFVPMQRALARADTMMEYIQHTSSAVFACPPGLRDGEYWGQRLLDGQV
jgi:deferrochelatase/peroxidase EfeB